jgi:hypothetical protein
MLPSEEQTLLLRSALWPAGGAREALLAWQARGPRPAARLARDHDGGKLLAPLICARVRDDQAGGLEARLLTYLRTALVREELRGGAYREILGELLGVLARAGPPAILLGGAALAETTYPRPELRHSHGILLMVPEEEEAAAVALLPAAGFRIPAAGRPGDPVAAVHASGLPLWLYRSPPTFAQYRRIDLWQRAETRLVLGSLVRVPAPADQLFLVCARAAAGERRSTLLWACDLWHLVAAEGELAWGAVVDLAASTGASLPVWVLLGYLADGLGTKIPSSVLDRLAVDAGRAGALAGEIALTGAAWRPGPKLLPFLRAADSWRERAIVARWRLFPSPTALLATGRIRGRAQAPLFYATRPFRPVLSRARQRFGGDSADESIRLPRWSESTR